MLIRASRIAGTPTADFVMPLKVTLSGLADFALAPFQGGYADLRPTPSDPNTATGVFTFTIPTPGFLTDAVDETDGIHAFVIDPAAGTAGAKVTNSRNTYVHFGPQTQR